MTVSHHYLQSLTDRTLDQMCTVTRPGLASIAASTAVELLVSVLQHPDGYVGFHVNQTVSYSLFCSVNAPAPVPQTGKDAPDPHESGSVLGLVPHQLRGFLAEFRNMPIKGAAYSRCTGCSDTVRYVSTNIRAMCSDVVWFRCSKRMKRVDLMCC